MFEVSVKARFSAAHNLRGYAGSCSEVHGHNWDVQVFICGEELDELGMLVDFRSVRGALNEIISGLDHRNLNDLPAFISDNPTSENLARYIYRELKKVIDDKRIHVARVCVFETPDTHACYGRSFCGAEEYVSGND